MINDEATLILIIAALYLFDSVLTLAVNEAVLVRVAKGRWFASFGLQNYRLAGREPYVPNPFTPHRRLYLLAWSHDAKSMQFADQVAQLDADTSLDALAPFLFSMALALFVLLPLGLFSRLGILSTYLAVALFYTSAIAALVVAYRRLHEMEITARQFAAIRSNMAPACAFAETCSQ